MFLLVNFNKGTTFISFCTYAITYPCLKKPRLPLRAASILYQTYTNLNYSCFNALSTKMIT